MCLFSHVLQKSPKKVFGGSSKRRSEPESSASSVPAVRRKEPTTPDAVEKITTTSAGPAEGIWKITLNQKPPPVSNIILFLPVCENLSNNQLIVSPGSSSTPQVAPALDFPTGNKQLPVCNLALDLSKKCISSDSIPPPSIKTEPEERDEILKSESKEDKKTSFVAKTVALDTKNLEPMESTLPILITDVRTEAQGAECGAPESCQLAKKEIQM